MQIESVYHKSKSNYSYNYDGKNLYIVLRTKKNDIDEVELVYGDSSHFESGIWVYKSEKMILGGSGLLHDYWEIKVTPDFKRLRYCFKIKKSGEKLYYTEKGFYPTLPTNDVNYHFCFPYMHASEVFAPPVWVKNTVWYQIFPERFDNGDPSINPSNIATWGEDEPTYNNFFGGDIQGIINRLDYLEDLGITGIYLTPIFKAVSNHKYDTIDYFEIDPQFGSKEKFKELIHKCHSKGIRVIIDAVFNHSGYYFEPFQDLIKNGEKSSYKDWFFVEDFPIRINDYPNYETFGFEPSMPKLKTENSEVKNYLLKVAEYWTKEFDIDGWRLDVASEINHEFWREFRQTVKTINPDAYILGEVWQDSLPWLTGDQFDGTMNYPYTYSMKDHFVNQTTTTKEFTESIMDVLYMYPKNVNEAQFNLLDSHDTKRVLTMVNNDKRKAKLMYFFHFTFVGTPCLYYGSEIGINGGDDPENRKCMVWEKDKQDTDMFYFVKKLINLRKNKKAFSHQGSFSFLREVSEELIVYERDANGEKVICIINNNDSSKKISLRNLKDKTVMELISNRPTMFNELGEIVINPYGCYAFEL